MSQNETSDNLPQIKMLQEKIRNQAKRLCSFQEYISLCEKRILQFNPKENIPLTKYSLNNPPVIQNQEIFQKYEELQRKYNSLYESTVKQQSNRSPRKNSNQIRPKSIEGESYDDLVTLYNKLQSENEKLIEERETMMETIRKEMVNNDEQRNYIEILKQALESSLLKTGLKGKIDKLKQKYYKDTPKDEYAKVIIDISTMKEQNNELATNNNKLIKEVKENAKEICEMKNKINMQKQNIDTLQNNYTILKEEKEQLDKIKEQYDQKEYEFNKLMDTCDKLSKENETVQQLKQSNEVMKNDLICLNQTLANLQNKFDCMSIESNRLKNIETEYSTLSKENLDTKRINLNLSKENNCLIKENEMLKQNLRTFTQIKEENMSVNSEIGNLRNQMALLRNEKNKNETFFLAKIESLTQEKNVLENILYKKELQSYRKEEEPTNNLNEKAMKLKELNMKYEQENKFYTDLLYRIIKFHISNLNVRNIILDILNLNEKSTMLNIEYNKTDSLIKTTYSSGNLDENVRNRFYFTKGQLNELNQKIDMLENELKQYEVQ